MSLRRKFMPNLTVWLPRLMERSSMTWYCVTLRPWGKLAVTELFPCVPPRSENNAFPVKAMVSYGIAARRTEAGLFGSKIVLYHIPEATRLLTTLGLNTCVQFNWPSSVG